MLSVAVRVATVAGKPWLVMEVTVWGGRNLAEGHNEVNWFRSNSVDDGGAKRC